MTYSFNLVDEPWIPCMDRRGSVNDLSLLDTLTRAHELVELAGESPLVTAALYRLLLAVLHRVFGPDSPGAWAALWEQGRWDEEALARYLGKWRHRFDLFAVDRPFYQWPDERVKQVPASNMMHDAASGSNSMLLYQHTDAEHTVFTPAQAARAVVVAQSFGLGGKAAGTTEVGTDGSCARGAIFLAQGDTLFQTLALNLVRYPDKEYKPLPHHTDDLPAWEMDNPYQPDRQTPRGYLDCLTWQNRKIMLFPEETPEGVRVRRVTRGPALRLNMDTTDPMKLYFKVKDAKPDKPAFRLLRFTEDRALWRDSAALFRLHDEALRVPHVFDWLANLVYEGYIESSQAVRYLALGMASDQAKVDFFRMERMPLPLRYQDKDAQPLVNDLGALLALAEDVGRALREAAQFMAYLLLKPDEEGSWWDIVKDRNSSRRREDAAKVASEWNVERRYWGRLEIPFRRVMEMLPTARAATQDGWAEELRRTARAAFDQVAENLAVGARGLKATVKASDQLAVGLSYALNDKERKS